MAATPAIAQDTSGNFDGFHVEAVAGYDIVEISIDEDVFGETLSDDQGGFAYGVAAGYDVSIGGTLLGVEIEYADSGVGIEDSYVGELLGSEVDIAASLDAGRDLYAGIRLGGQLSDRSLVYVKAGYTNARAKFSMTATFDGLRLGVGSEFAFSKNAFAKVEYRLSMYGDGEAEMDGENADIGEIFEYGDLNRHQIVLGLGLRF
jgi:outer membrane immunogenic protein